MTYGVAIVLAAVLLAGVVLVAVGARRGCCNAGCGPDGSDTMSRTCPDCGHVQQHGTRYCGHCGREFNDESGNAC